MKPTEWFYDLRRVAPRDQWYRIERSLTDRERAAAGLDKVRTLEQRGRDSLAGPGTWTTQLIDEHGVEWDDDSIRTGALYLATEELAEETRKGAPALDPKREALLLTAARQRIYFRATQGILTPEDELFPLREGELLPRLLSKPWTEEIRAAARGRAVTDFSSDSECEKRRRNAPVVSPTWSRKPWHEDLRPPGGG